MPTVAETPEPVTHPTILMAAVAVVATNALLLSPVLSEVAASLGSTHVATALAVSIYGAGVALSALLIAPRIDRIGALRALELGLPVLGVGLLGSATAPHVSVLLGTQALAGVSAGIILPASYALATASGPPAVAARTLSRVLLGWSIAFICGIPGLAALTDHSSWRVPYAVLLGATLVLWLRIHRSREPQPPPVRALAQADPVSVAAHAPAGIPAGTIVGSRPYPPARWRRAMPSVAVGLCFATAVGGAFAFFADEARHASELSASVAAAPRGFTVIADHVNLRVAYGAGLLGVALVVWLWIRTSREQSPSSRDATTSIALGPAEPWRRVVAVVAACLCFASAFYGVFAFFADEVRQAAGMSATVTGLIILAFGVGFACARSAGAIAVRVGVARFLPLVLLGNATVYVLMTIARHHEATVFAVALGWGALTNAVLTTIVLLFTQVESHRRGRALGINSATTYVGAMVGTAAAGAAYSTTGFQSVLLGAAALQLCGAAVIWIVFTMGVRRSIAPEETHLA